MSQSGDKEFWIRSTLTLDEYRDFSARASDAASRDAFGRWGSAYVLHGWWFAPVAFLLALGLFARLKGDTLASFEFVGAATGFWLAASIVTDALWRKVHRAIEKEEFELVVDARGLAEAWRGVSWSAPWSSVETVEATAVALIARTYSGVAFYAPLRAFSAPEKARECVDFSQENANVARSS